MPFAARFIAANRRLSRAVEDLLPQSFRRHLHTFYKYEVAEWINRRPGLVVLDIGGGKSCPFVQFIDEPWRHTIIAVDADEVELRRNPDLGDKLVADAAAPHLPFRDGSVDLIVSRSVVEHLRDNRAFFANCARTLRPGGALIHTFPCRFAPFALLNQILPNPLTRRLIARFHPQWQDECGFPARYDRCWFSAMRRLLESCGFENPRFAFRYYQSIYFDFFFPLYLVMLSYDLIVFSLGMRNLACAMLVTAERPAPAVGDRAAEGCGQEAPPISIAPLAVTACADRS